MLLWLFTSCTQRMYISEEVIYSVDDSSEVLVLQGNTDNNSTKNIAKQEQLLIESVVNYSQKYLGKPYKYGGTTPEGFDCSGFVQYVYKACGVQIPRMPADMAAMSDKIDYKDIRPGDLVYFKGSNINSSEIGHIALVVEKTANGFKFIHSTTSKGVIISDIDDYDYWKTRYLFATRFKKETILEK